jgi:hypothetical protein
VSDRLRQIIRDAQVNHWAPHLGLKTDAERVQYLVKQLEFALDEIDDRAQCEECDFCDDHQ